MSWFGDYKFDLNQSYFILVGCPEGGSRNVSTLSSPVEPTGGDITPAPWLCQRVLHHPVGQCEGTCHSLSETVLTFQNCLKFKKCPRLQKIFSISKVFSLCKPDLTLLKCPHRDGSTGADTHSEVGRETRACPHSVVRKWNWDQRFHSSWSFYFYTDRQQLRHLNRWDFIPTLTLHFTHTNVILLSPWSTQIWCVTKDIFFCSFTNM